MGKTKVEHFNNKTYIGYFIVIILSIIVSFSFFIFILEMRVVNVKYDELKLQEENIINLEKGLLGKEFDGIISDLLYLSENFISVNTTSDLDQTANKWRIFSERRKIYDQIRYIDNNGNEIIRVNYLFDEAVVIEDDMLQNKSGRYYFSETLKLDKDQIYISKLDLNVENNVVEYPLKPVVRFSKAIYSEDELIGVIVLNYRAEFLLSVFKEISSGSDGEIFLINSDGDWFSSSGDTLKWGFSDETIGDKFQNVFVVEWEDIKNTEGALKTNNGLFSFGNIVVSDNLEVNGDSLSSKIVLGDGFWKVVSFIDIDGPMKNVIDTSDIAVAIRLFKENLVNLIMVTLISTVVAVLFISNKRSILQIKYYSEYDSLTNVLNRRAGLISLMNILPHASNKVERVSLCFLDINGLKQVNDSLGHDTGDELIKTVTKVFKETIGTDDFIVRLGGDEFIIVFVNKNIDESELSWNNIKKEINHINKTEKRKYIVSVSHGIVEYNKEYKDFIDEFIKAADKKMYLEKKEIKKNIQILKEK